MAVPEYCVLTFFADELHKMHQRNEVRIVKKLRSEMGTHLVFQTVGESDGVVLFNPGVGAPLAAAMFEEVIALGCRSFIACGSAGVLDPEIEVGELLIPVSAVRDEGTSYHYLPPAREVAASEHIVREITHVLETDGLPYSKTKTWTTDAIYRETPVRINKRRAEGCSCVEMEAAALFAVAHFRKTDIAMLLYAGDDVSGSAWQSRDWLKQQELRHKLIQLGIKICRKLQKRAGS
jgi:uridine phosphorylase